MRKIIIIKEIIIMMMIVIKIIIIILTMKEKWMTINKILHIVRGSVRFLATVSSPAKKKKKFK